MAVELDQELKKRLAALREAEAKERRLRRLKTVERLILLPILAVVGVLFVFLGRVKVVGDSMAPTLHNGQTLLVLKNYRLLAPLKVGDVVVIQPGEGKGRDAELIKRIVFLQDEKGRRPWPAEIATSAGPLPPAALFPRWAGGLAPPGALFVLGDNFDNSTDSRAFGPVFEREILGKVLVR